MLQSSSITCSCCWFFAKHTDEVEVKGDIVPEKSGAIVLWGIYKTTVEAAGAGGPSGGGKR